LETIKRLTKDKSNRPLLRLQKLSSFGLIDYEIIYYEGRYDHYYFISLEGIYVILAHLTEKQILPFLKTNMNTIPGFLVLFNLNPNSDLKLRYFLGQIRSMIKQHNYYLIEYFLKKWFKDNFGTRVILKFYKPNIKNKLKQVYEHDPKFLKELQKQYGR